MAHRHVLPLRSASALGLQSGKPPHVAEAYVLVTSASYFSGVGQYLSTYMGIGLLALGRAFMKRFTNNASTPRPMAVIENGSEEGCLSSNGCSHALHGALLEWHMAIHVTFMHYEAMHYEIVNSIQRVVQLSYFPTGDLMTQSSCQR
ncbi:hypothetical protein BJV78DRAFT_1355169 [Lactifluus subvellereus]|nr:hypothetical protein BJV78DRAFT_1355169 [Lactifluus subvellereus]